MGSAVFVWPLNLIGGVYADLHAGRTPSGPFELIHTNLSENGARGDQMTFFFDFETPLSSTGRITLSASGGRFNGAAEAERSAVAAMLEALRRQHQISPADYNFVVIAENRALYDAMKAALGGFRAAYGSLYSSVEEVKQALGHLCSELSCWLGRKHISTAADETIAVSGFHAIMGYHVAEMERDMDHGLDLVNMMMKRDGEPPERKRLEQTVPMPMTIDWERSYYTLRTIYDQAVKKLGSDASNVRFVQMADGNYKATININAEPYMFWSPACPSKMAAKAKLLYSVIKHVNEGLGYAIIDMHYVVRMQQDTFIRRFDHKMDGILRCGERLKRLMDSTGHIFTRNFVDLTGTMADNQCNAVVYDQLQVFSEKLLAAKGAFDGTWAEFQALKVDTTMVRAQLAYGA